MTIKPEMTLQ